MAEGMGLPSMFDTQYAMERQMETDAQTTGRLPLGGGMMYASSMKGDIRNQSLMNLAGMLGGTGDPRMEKQKAVESVMKEFGKQPETIEDYKTIAKMFNSIGQYDFAEKAMAMANQITASAPERKTIEGADGYKYYVDDGSRVLPGVNKPSVAGKLGTVEIPTEKNGVRYTQKWNTVDGVPTTMLGEQPTDAPGKPTELSLDQLFTDTVERDPAYKAAVASGNVAAQQKIIATAKRNLALSDDISNQQVQLFTVESLDKDGNTILLDVWRGRNKTTNQWVDLESTEQQKKAAVTRTYVKDTDDGKFSITEESVNGRDFVEIARTNVDTIPNSFEQVAVNHVLSTPGYENLDKETQSELLLEAKKSISIPTTESAINAAYRDINENFIRLAQQEASVNGNENFQSEGRTIGNTKFLEWKNSLAENIAKAGGNTDISDVLGQYKQWDNLTSKVMNDFDQMANLKVLIGQAKGQKAGSDESIKQSAAAWATATRLIVSLTKDSNLSTAEVQTVANAGSIPRKLSNLISKAATGVSTDASIKEIEEIAFGLEQSIIRRYNRHHTSFNETMILAGTNTDLLKSMTGDLLSTPVTTRAATKNNLVEEAIRRGIYNVVDGITYDQNGNPIME